MKDLTKGNPGKLMIQFAIPILIGNIFQLFYILVDTRIVGSTLGTDALAAVGATSTVNNLVIGFLIGLTNGFAILAARDFGAQRYIELRKVVANILKLGLIISFILTLLSVSFLEPLLMVLNMPEDLMMEGMAYIKVILLGMTASMLYNVCASVLRAIGDTVTPLLFLIGSTIMNIGLDYLFILGFKTGVEGAAYATVIAQSIAAMMCFIYIWKRYPMLHIKKEDFKHDCMLSRALLTSGLSMGMMQSLVSLGTVTLQSAIRYPMLHIKKEDFKHDCMLSRALLTSGLSMGMMQSLVSLGTVTLQSAINQLGTHIIVAHTGARKVTEIFMLPFSVLGMTMATYCSQNLGAGKIERIKKGLKQVLLVAWGWCLIVTLASYTIAPTLIQLVTATQLQEVIETATLYLRIDTLFYFVPAMISILRNALQGLGDHIMPIVSSSIELVGKVLVVLFLTPVLGYMGIILAEPIVWVLMVIPLIVRIYTLPVLKEIKERK